MTEKGGRKKKILVSGIRKQTEDLQSTKTEVKKVVTTNGVTPELDKEVVLDVPNILVTQESVTTVIGSKVSHKLYKLGVCSFS